MAQSITIVATILLVTSKLTTFAEERTDGANPVAMGAAAATAAKTRKELLNLMFLMLMKLLQINDSDFKPKCLDMRR